MRTGAVRIPVTEAEATELLLKSAHAEQYIPLIFGSGGLAITVDGDGSALWALGCLARMRGIMSETV